MSQFSEQARFRRHVLPVLTRHGKEIGVRSQEGDENCASIVHLYTMLSNLRLSYTRPPGRTTPELCPEPTLAHGVAFH